MTRATIRIKGTDEVIGTADEDGVFSDLWMPLCAAVSIAKTLSLRTEHEWEAIDEQDCVWIEPTTHVSNSVSTIVVQKGT